MKVQFAWLPLALALTAVAQPVAAADWGVPRGGVVNGGIRDFGGGVAVPVPAPVPVPDLYSRASWYLRIDGGLGSISDPDVSERGFVYGLDSGSGFSGGDHDFKPAWFSTDFDTSVTLGGGIGWYSGRGWRLDATVEHRSEDKISADADEQYVQYESACGGWCPRDTDVNAATNHYSNLRVTDRTKIDGTLWMMNAYYDLASRGRFTPYIGAGLGVSWNEIERTHTSTTSQCAVETTGPTDCAGGYTVVSSSTASAHVDSLTFAASAMAGVTMDVSDLAKLDMGYRYIFIGGTDQTLNINGVESTIDIGDQHIHQVRAGLRVDIH